MLLQEITKHFKLIRAAAPLAPGEADVAIAAVRHRIELDMGISQQRRIARHLRQEGDAQVGIDHFDQRQQAARSKILHLLGIANLAGGERVIAQAMAVLE